MKVAALLSGGKDSVAALDVARGHAWDVACAIVLVPVEDDAWMFHVPNITVAEGVADAMGVPIVRAPVRSGQHEEVQDLAKAVRAARDTFGIEGVISGALASEYQRTRIDAVGHSLGLKTFAPLWHVAPEPYFRQMVRHYDVRMVRAAADGLDSSWLGRRLTDSDIDDLARRRMHVAGEGGEFETIVLDGPHHAAALVVDDGDVEESASRSTWHIRKWHVAQD